MAELSEKLTELWDLYDFCLSKVWRLNIQVYSYFVYLLSKRKIEIVYNGKSF